MNPANEKSEPNASNRAEPWPWPRGPLHDDKPLKIISIRHGGLQNIVNPDCLTKLHALKPRETVDALVTIHGQDAPAPEVRRSRSEAKKIGQPSAEQSKEVERQTQAAARKELALVDSLLKSNGGERLSEPDTRGAVTARLNLAAANALARTGMITNIRAALNYTGSTDGNAIKIPADSLDPSDIGKTVRFRTKPSGLSSVMARLKSLGTADGTIEFEGTLTDVRQWKTCCPSDEWGLGACRKRCHTGEPRSFVHITDVTQTDRPEKSVGDIDSLGLEPLAAHLLYPTIQGDLHVALNPDDRVLLEVDCDERGIMNPSRAIERIHQLIESEGVKESAHDSDSEDGGSSYKGTTVLVSGEMKLIFDREFHNTRLPSDGVVGGYASWGSERLTIYEKGETRMIATRRPYSKSGRYGKNRPHVEFHNEASDWIIESGELPREFL